MSYSIRINTILSIFDEKFLADVEKKYTCPYPRETWRQLPLDKKLELILYLTDMLQQFYNGAVSYIEE